MSDDTMTLEELNARLKGAGLDPKAGWQEGKKVKLDNLDFMAKVKASAGRIQALLETQVQTDLQKVMELREALARIEHGGGK